MSVVDEAEDGIRDLTVTGVQTCALPIWILDPEQRAPGAAQHAHHRAQPGFYQQILLDLVHRIAHGREALGLPVESPRKLRLKRRYFEQQRSEERRVGKECRCRWSTKQKTAYEI